MGVDYNDLFYCFMKVVLYLYFAGAFAQFRVDLNPS